MAGMNIEIVGLDKLMKKLEHFPDELQRSMRAAGEEAANEVLSTEGLQKYPPAGPYNEPPTPYYIRGRGTQISPTKNLFNSEKAGTQWYVKPFGAAGTQIGNRASYAKYLFGEKQASWAPLHGWKQLYKTAKEQIHKIRDIYIAHLRRAIDKLGL
jgi:hypothetical protein